MNNIWINGKPGIKVNAEQVIWGSTPKAKLYNIDGDQRWVPNSLCHFEIGPESKEQLDRGVHAGDIKGTLIVEEWFYKKLFPNG